MSEANELTGGRWVTRGLIRVWTGPRPLDRPDHGKSAGNCVDCQRTLVTARSWMKLDPAYRESVRDTHARQSTPERCGQCQQRIKRGGGPRRVAQCGTHGGYEAHRRRGEVACTPCLEAMRAYKRQREALKKEAS